MPAREGASDAAREIGQLIDLELRRYAEPRVALLVSDIEQIFADSNGNGRIDRSVVDADTAENSIKFAYLLPRSFPTPEVAPDPDGDISFDWIGESGKMFSVSVDARGRLAYAGSFNNGVRVHGTQQLSEICPPEIIWGIKKAIT
jgi:hypothetical protein